MVFQKVINIIQIFQFINKRLNNLSQKQNLLYKKKQIKLNSIVIELTIFFNDKEIPIFKSQQF